VSASRERAFAGPFVVSLRVHLASPILSWNSRRS
jgi:hypothetical protein